MDRVGSPIPQDSARLLLDRVRGGLLLLGRSGASAVKSRWATALSDRVADGEDAGHSIAVVIAESTEEGWCGCPECLRASVFGVPQPRFDNRRLDEDGLTTGGRMSMAITPSATCP